MASIETAPPMIEGGRSSPSSWPWQILAVVALILSVLLPLLAAHAAQLWLRPHYQLFPVALLGAAVLAWQRWREVKPLTPGSRPVSYGLVGLAWIVLALAVAVNSSWLGAVSALILLAAALVGVGGGRLFARMLPAWVMLWLVVPPPFELDRNLILSLQTLTAQWSNRILDLLGVFHVMDGHVVEVSGRRLLVEEACAGINSLFSVLTCTLLFVFWARRPVVRAVLLLAAAVVWVLAANVARVVLIGWLFSSKGLDLATGWRHDVLGLSLFALALVLVWSTDRLLAWLAGAGTTPPGKKAAPADTQNNGVALAQAESSPAVILGRTWLSSWTVAGAFGALLLLSLLLRDGGAEAGSLLAEDAVAASLPTLTADSLPKTIGLWERQQFAEESRNPGSAFGEFSRVWTYQQQLQRVHLSLDYPFPGWHDLTRCYTSQGWVIEDQAVEGAGSNMSEKYVAIRLTKPGHRSGYLLFAEFDRRGKILEPRLGGADLSLTRQGQTVQRLWDRLQGAPATNSVDSPGPVYQLQLFVESYAPLNQAEQDQTRALFLQGWRRLSQHWGMKGQAD